MTDSNGISDRVNLDEVRQAVLSGHAGISAAGEGKSVLWHGNGSLLEHYLNLPPDRPETWKQHPRFPAYEVSDKGRHRRNGRVLSQRTGNRGYVQMDFTGDDGRRATVSAHRAVLETFAGPCPEGQESLHGTYARTVNWWPENLRWGTKQENEADKDNPGPPQPAFPCRNAPACGNMVLNENRRCRPCVKRAGTLAGVWLRRYGMGLEDVTQRLGYENCDWVWKLAREFGGVTMTKRDALRQRPNLVQRARITLRDRRENGWSDAA